MLSRVAGADGRLSVAAQPTLGSVVISKILVPQSEGVLGGEESRMGEMKRYCTVECDFVRLQLVLKDRAKKKRKRPVDRVQK